MPVHIVVPKSVRGGWYWNPGWWAFGIMAHSLQCDQVGIFLIRYRQWKFGYRTMGDAKPNIVTSKDAGWHWPWRPRPVSGRW